MAYTHNPSTQEEETGGWAGGHPELHSKFKESPDNQILPHLQKFIKDLFVFMCIHFFSCMDMCILYVCQSIRLPRYEANMWVLTTEPPTGASF